MSSIAAIIVRVFLILFGAVVLGLSVTLAKQELVGQPPSETSFGSFIGAFSIIVSFIGLVSLWADKISGLPIIVVDVLTAIFNLAGAIALTVAMKGAGACSSTVNTDIEARQNNKILNGGCPTDTNDVTCIRWAQDNDFIAIVSSRCHQAQADYVFEYLAFIFGVMIIVADWVLHKRRGGGGASYV